MKRVMTVVGWLLAAVGGVGTAGVVVGDLVNPFFNDLPALAAVFIVLALLSVRASKALAGTFVMLGLLWAGTGLLRPSGPTAVKTLVFGVDGATFEVLDARSDQLPHFTRLRADATRATLVSMEPMFSPLLWTTIASGRRADDHGIRGFRVHSHDCKVARFWDVAEADGRGVGLYKWLVDYPPRAFAHGGFWVPSWLAPDIETWPASLSVVKELELSKRLRRKQVAAKHSAPELAWKLVGAGMRLSTLLEAAKWSFQERFLQPSKDAANVRMQELRGWIDRDVFVAQTYAEQPQLATFNYYATDGLAHLYWDRHLKGGDEVMTAYRQADAILGELRGMLGPDARLVVVSDHGFKAMDDTGLAGQFAPLTERLRARLSAEVGAVDVSKVGHKLTVAVQSTDQRERARALLEGLQDAAGDPFYRVEDMPDTELALALTLADEAITKERLASDTVGGEPIKDYVALTDAYTGTHKANGIFFTAGPGAEPGRQLADVPLLDMAPTILAAMELPAAENMPGKAQVYPEKPRVASHDLLVQGLKWMGGSDDVNEDQLKALGYIGDAQ